MADILLFGATGYTGKLTAAALARRGADFSIAGRDPEKLKRVAAATGATEVHLVEVGDVRSLVSALDGSRAMITCVGPFMELGDTAVEAAIEAGVHYIDSTGEGLFIDRLIETYDARARRAGMALAPAMAFDEIPADVCSTLAAEGLERPAITVTYSLPMAGSAGTIVSSLSIITSQGPFIVEGEKQWVRAGELERWSPLPPPLGPKRAVSFPMAELRLAPLHLDVATYQTFVTLDGVQRTFLRRGFPVAKALLSAVEPLAKRFLQARFEGPDEDARRASLWTILAEARSGDRWRNVALSGTDPYGLSAETLARAAIEMSSPGFDKEGVLSPVGALGKDVLIEELTTFGVKIDTYAPA